MERLKRTAETTLKERVMQFGEGNFLRGFADWMIDRLNKEANWNGGVVVVQPLPGGMCDKLNEQGGLYHLYLRGLQNGEKTEETRVVDCITRAINPYEDTQAFFDCAKNPDLRFIISNTTEAGIEYRKTEEDFAATTYPGRLTMFLKARFDAKLPGFILLPCELIDKNGAVLKECVLKYAEDFNYGQAFTDWVNSECHFTSTLVDRIVTGYPREEAPLYEKEYGCLDYMIDTAEIFHLWVIEGDKALAEEIPFHKHGMNVIWTDDVNPYKKRKVRILNGAHTMMVSAAVLAGLETVGEAMDDEDIFAFMKDGLFNEIIPAINIEDAESFANDVIERFKNPFIKHRLMDIALNSVSKFKVRVLPTIFEYYEKNNTLPKNLTFALAALLFFYKNGQPRDAEEVINDIKGMALEDILKSEKFWDADLSFMSGEVINDYKAIEENGVRSALKCVL